MNGTHKLVSGIRTLVASEVARYLEAELKAQLTPPPQRGRSKQHAASPPPPKQHAHAKVRMKPGAFNHRPGCRCLVCTKIRRAA